jgi:hypothetical protein
MYEKKPSAIRLDVFKETGEVMLCIKTECGFHPVLSWPNIKSLESFINNLSVICSMIESNKNTGNSENS